MNIPSVMGQPMLGADVVSNTALQTGTWNSIYCMTATVFATWGAANESGTMTGVSFPAGTWIYGQIKSFSLTSGIVRAHRV